MKTEYGRKMNLIRVVQLVELPTLSEKVVGLNPDQEVILGGCWSHLSLCVSMMNLDLSRVSSCLSHFDF